jgi:hypothetical protein
VYTSGWDDWLRRFFEKNVLMKNRVRRERGETKAGGNLKKRTLRFFYFFYFIPD